MAEENMAKYNSAMQPGGENGAGRNGEQA